MSEPIPLRRPSAADCSVLKASSPDDLLAVVPYQVGFHPTDSLVVVAVSAERGRLGFSMRLDLPDARQAPSVADHAVAALRRNDTDSAVVMAYSDSAALADPVVEEMLDRLDEEDIVVLEALRADGARWFSYLCDGPCCPAHGTEYDVSCHPLTAAAVVQGGVALPDRAALEASVAPVQGITAVSMAQATARAEDALLAEESNDEPDALADLLQQRMRALVCAFLDNPRRLRDDEIADAAVWARSIRVRDVAWMMMTRADAEQHLALWRQVLGRVVPPYEPAPACLTAFAAWLHGNGALAGCALDRALAADPGYSMAHLISEALHMALPPSTWEEMRREMTG